MLGALLMPGLASTQTGLLVATATWEWEGSVLMGGGPWLRRANGRRPPPVQTPLGRDQDEEEHPVPQRSEDVHQGDLRQIGRAHV